VLASQKAAPEDIIAGNYYNKYQTRNPIARFLTRGFLAAAQQLVERTSARDIHEVGCGEGYLLHHLAKPGRTLRGSDVSAEVVQKARQLAGQKGMQAHFDTRSVYDLSEEDAAELIICCEVLEHLEEPERALALVRSLARPWFLVSVPREPIWRALNLARGRYWSEWGNTPGHTQHWSRLGFLSLVSRYADIVEVRSPLPWTVVLCRTTLTP